MRDGRGMKQPHWARLEARRLGRIGFQWCALAGGLHILVLMILVPALLSQRPLSLTEAGVAAGAILWEFKLWRRLPALRKAITTLEQAARQEP